MSLRDYVEKGIFEPAHRLLTRDGNRGDVRFSVLQTDGRDFVMARGDVLFPALGHSLEARQQFRLAIDDAFAGVAYRTATVQRSGDVAADHRFKPHPQARPERSYRSIVSVPLRAPGGAEIDGVFNVIATEPQAFSAVDRTYAALLGAVIDVARAAQVAAKRRPEHPPQ
jgi:GAF domain-containing protein